MSFRILAIDGGGARGVFPAHILASMTKQLGPLHETFDLVVGTSTGSILAGAVAIGANMDRVCSLYETKVPLIFVKRFSLRGGLRSKYDAKPLRSLLKEVFQTQTFSEAKTRLMVVATDISNGNVFVMKSSYLDAFIRDGDILLADGIAASCAAPSYFDPVQIKEYLLADGGLWGNNPSLIAYTEAVGKLKIPPDDVRILSIGTGTGHQYYDPGSADQKAWGLGSGWGATKLIDTFLNVQSRSASNMTQLLLEDRYLRISFDETGTLVLDEPSAVPQLKARAATVFTHESARIRAFLNS
jgi:patatin-like phospholipase/acyl hydrolase